jgi:hypothetical protein
LLIPPYYYSGRSRFGLNKHEDQTYADGFLLNDPDWVGLAETANRCYGGQDYVVKLVHKPSSEKLVCSQIILILGTLEGLEGSNQKTA